jgi:hypothetical protein
MTVRWRPAWELEQEARAINAEPWEPMPGMVKRQCPWCRYFFAAPAHSHEPRCPDCTRANSPRRRISAPHAR